MKKNEEEIQRIIKTSNVINIKRPAQSMTYGTNVLVYSDMLDLETKIEILKKDILEKRKFKIQSKIIDVFSHEQSICFEDMIERNMIEKKPVCGVYVFFVYNNSVICNSNYLRLVTTVIFCKETEFKKLPTPQVSFF